MAEIPDPPKTPESLAYETPDDQRPASVMPTEQELESEAAPRTTGHDQIGRAHV